MLVGSVFQDSNLEAVLVRKRAAKILIEKKK